MNIQFFLKKFLPFFGAKRIAKARLRFSKELQAVVKGIEELAAEASFEDNLRVVRERKFAELQKRSQEKTEGLRAEIDSAERFRTKLAEFIN